MSKAVVTDLIKQAVRESAEDPAYFGRFFLRKWFPLPLAPFQLGMLALFTRRVSFLDKYPEAHEFILSYFKYKADPGDPNSADIPVFYRDAQGRICMAAGSNNAAIVPRGFSKTTLMKLAFLYDLCTDPNTFGIYVSESSGHSERQLGDIKKQLERNQLLRKAYGDLVPARSDAEKWGADEIQLTSGAILVALGRGSQVRGLLYDGKRPNKVLLDDVEDKESVSTDAQRSKVSSWFYSDVVPAGNEMDAELPEEYVQQDMQITVVGTLLGADALLMTLQKDVTFNHISFGAVAEWNYVEELDKQGDARRVQTTPKVMLWPEKMGFATYLAKREQYRRAGKLAEFTREWDSQIRVEEDALFKYRDISLYMPTPLSALVQIAMACDPAISPSLRSDSAAIVAGGRRDDGMLWVLDEWGKQGATPRELVNKLFEWFERFERRAKVGIEAQQYQAALIFLMREEMARRQMFFTVVPIVQGNDKKKEDRIAGVLQPRYSNGYVRHQKMLPNYEAQLQDFPNGKKDYADAGAMMFTLLGETAMLASPADAQPEADEYEALEPAFGSLYGSTQSHIFTHSDDYLRGRYGPGS